MKNDPKPLQRILSDNQDKAKKALERTAPSKDWSMQARVDQARKPMYLTRYE